MKPSIQLLRIGGINIGVHYSWFLLLLLVTWSLAVRFLPEQSPGWSTTMYWIAGIASALLLFASVLVHELAHSLVARARGFRVEGITLFLLGGVSNLRAEAQRPRDEFVISIAGPLVSFGLSGLLWATLLGLPDREMPIAVIVRYLAFINLLLGVFNLLPAFPLDGGRILRSILWGATGNLLGATRIAAFGGQAMGVLLMAFGGLSIWMSNPIGGVWLFIIGWFLLNAATGSRRATAMETYLKGVRVQDVMDADPACISPDVPLSTAVFEFFLRRGMKSLPVCDGGRLLGIITLTDIRNVPRDRWGGVRVADAMTPIPLWQVTPDDDALHAMSLLGEHSIHEAPVVDGHRLVGLLSRAHIIRYIHSRRELGMK